MTKIHIIIPAGGSGKRFGGEEKKQFLEIGGESLLNRVLRVFDEHPSVVQIIVALPFEELSRLNDDPCPLCQNAKINYVMGGTTRSLSVYQGFMHLRHCEDDDVVLIHDAARPLVSLALIDRVVSAVCEYGCAIPVLPLSDTIKEKDDSGQFVKRTIDRNSLCAVQTPQGFTYGLLKRLYHETDFRSEKFTDEARLAESLGQRVKLVDGEVANIKVTTPFDLKLAESLCEML